MSTLTTDQAPITERRPAVAEDVLRGPLGDGPWEIYHGCVVELSFHGLLIGRIAMQMFIPLYEFAEGRNNLQALASNVGFLLHRNPDTLLSPKTSLFRSDRAKGKKDYPEFPPELAIEIVTPENSLRIVQIKAAMYLHAGSEQVWIAAPQRKVLEVRFADGHILEARDGIYTATGIAEGLKVDLRDVFMDVEANGG